MAGSSSGSGGGVPPGFRFHPTDEELLHFYLRKKVSFQRFDMEVIREVDLNKIEPWDLQERCKIGSTPQNEWYFFSHKDRKYPTGSRTNRATSAGFWKATGRDKCIRNSFNKIGMRKTLVFYRGRAPHGQKTDWIMHEYRLEEDSDPQSTTEDGWVVCRVFKKKNLFKVASSEGGAHNNNSSGMMTIETMSDQLSLCHSHASAQSPSALFSQRNHGIPVNQSNHYLFRPQVEHAEPNYSHFSVHPTYQQQDQYTQLEAQNILSTPDGANVKQLLLVSSDYNLSSNTTDYDDHHHHPHQSSSSVPEVITAGIQVKKFMSSSNCESASPTAAAGFELEIECNQSSQEWDERLAITTNQNTPNPGTSSINLINQLSLRSDMDFWAFGK